MLIGSFRLKPTTTAINIPSIGSGQSVETEVALITEGEPAPTLGPIQMAMKNNVDVFYFAADCPLHILFTADGALEKMTYLQTWKNIPDTHEHAIQIQPIRAADVNQLISALQAHNVFLIAKRRVNDNVRCTLCLLYPQLRVPLGRVVSLMQVTDTKRR
jgi:hypothetical protein